jgi:hypothetical protein
VTSAQIALIVLTILFEARNQPDLGKELVAHVIMNRLDHCLEWKAECSVEFVVFQHNAQGYHQFRAWQPEMMLWDSGGKIRSIEVRQRWLMCSILGQWPNPSCMGLDIDQEWWADMWTIAESVYGGKPEPEGYGGVVVFDNPRFWLKYGGLTPAARDKELAGCEQDHCFYRPRRGE